MRMWRACAVQQPIRIAVCPRRKTLGSSTGPQVPFPQELLCKFWREEFDRFGVMSPRIPAVVDNAFAFCFRLSLDVLEHRHTTQPAPDQHAGHMFACSWNERKLRRRDWRVRVVLAVAPFSKGFDALDETGGSCARSARPKQASLIVSCCGDGALQKCEGKTTEKLAWCVTTVCRDDAKIPQQPHGPNDRVLP